MIILKVIFCSADKNTAYTCREMFSFSGCELSSNSACRASISFEIVVGKRGTNFNKVQHPNMEKFPKRSYALR